MTIDINIQKSARMPLHAQIRKQILSMIESGVLQQDSPIPPEMELVEKYRISRTVIRHALNALTDEGYLYRIRGKGTFVSALKLQKYKNIGLIMPALGAELTLSQSPTNYLIFDGIQKFCHENSWDIQIISRKGEDFSFDDISKLNISGLIIVLPRESNYKLISELKKHPIPFLCINLHSEKVNKDVNYVNIDFYNAAMDAVNYLYQQGKRKIAIFSTHEMRDDMHQFHIIAGYKQAVKELGLIENIIDATIGSPSFLHDRSYLTRNYDSLITMDAANAVSIMKILKNANTDLPKGFSLLSFYENEESVKIGISSYLPDIQDVGYTSASAMEKILSSSGRKLQQFKIKLKLSIRGSV